MPKEKYKIKELSPTRILVESSSFWKPIEKDEIACILEALTSKGKKVISTIPFSGKYWKDYLILLQP